MVIKFQRTRLIVLSCVNNVSYQKLRRGSNNRDKKRKSLAREWQRVAELEKGKVHEITTFLVKNFSSRWVVEALKIPNMIKNNRLSCSIIEQQWGFFKYCLTYKAESAGGKVVEVNPKNTTQMCSNCGSLPREKLGLGQRTYHCYSCGQSMDRDVNAALNILQRGLASFSVGTFTETKGECQQSRSVFKDDLTS